MPVPDELREEIDNFVNKVTNNELLGKTIDQLQGLGILNNYVAHIDILGKNLKNDWWHIHLESMIA